MCSVGRKIVLVLVEVIHKSTEVYLGDKDLGVSFVSVFDGGFLELF